MPTIRNIDRQIHRAAKMQAAQEGITLKALTEKVLESYLEMQHPKREKEQAHYD